jgi:hypothetical protein
MDSHTSHIMWEFFDYFLQYRIIPFCLPAYSTHLLQLLDVGLFGPLQKYYSNGLDARMEAEDKGVNRGDFLG